MDQGWIKTHRKMLDDPMLMSDNTAYIVFTKLLMLVNSKTGSYRTGRFALAERTNVKPNTLYKALIRLEDNRLVTLTSNNKFTDISICNWKKYQSSSNNASNNKVTTREQQSNNKVTLNKNKEVRIKKEEVLVPKGTSQTSSSTSTTLKQFLIKLMLELGHSAQSKPTDGRLRKLKVRLNTYTAPEILQAAQNIRRNPFMQGDNDRNKRFGDIDYLLRSDEVIDKWLNEESGSTNINFKEMLNNAGI